jgi:hypothetical protein
MISKSLQEADKKYFMKNPRAKMLLQKINQTEKQMDMLIAKRNIQLAELFTFTK